jgi:homoaconitase/3-isopropylmalate dehydratase large subunit
MVRLTLFEKIWNLHGVYETAGQPALLHLDLHLVHEVTSPHSYEGLMRPDARCGVSSAPSRRWSMTCQLPTASCQLATVGTTDGARLIGLKVSRYNSNPVRCNRASGGLA